MSEPRISVCIATYRRLPRLHALLGDLSRQRRLPDQVIVVDNDASASARPAVELHRFTAPFEIVYAVQPQKNISLTRNRTVELADGDWLAFVDDDERAPPEWLSQLLTCAAKHQADGVLGPVEPLLPIEAPRWIKRGRFYDWARMATGTRVPPNRLRFGNVLLCAERVRAMSPIFDPAYGLTGGEDGDLLSRMTLAGSKIVWCDEATVTEPVESARLSLRWLLRRSLRGGQDFARHTVSGRYGPVTVGVRTRLLLRALLQALAACSLALLMWPLGRHHAANWLTKASANFGKLSIFCGWHYREYA
jgi:succinoglycan biosynthesis protein ExoM